MDVMSTPVGVQQPPQTRGRPRLPQAANTNLQPVAEETQSVAVWKLLGKPAAERRVSAADCSNSEENTHQAGQQAVQGAEPQQPSTGSGSIRGASETRGRGDETVLRV